MSAINGKAINQKKLTSASALAVTLACATPLATAKTNQPHFEDPFDLGGGGATLTRATQEGILVSNPAQLPYGGKFFRWVGMKTSISVDRSSIDVANDLASGGSEGGTEEEQQAAQQGQLDALFETPVHVGVAQSISFITNNGGFAIFTSLEPDIRAWRAGDTETSGGTPQLVVRNETYGGFVGSFAGRSMWRWLSFGLNLKYLAANDGIVRVDITDEESVAEAQQAAQEALGPTSVGQGAGGDLAMLMFFQGHHVDLRLGATAINAGGIALSNGDTLPQTVNGGIGLTFHTTQDAIHFSADYRDIQNEYDEPLYKRVYVGTKILLRTYLGISAGIYHGIPTYGAELDFVLFRIAAASYGREYLDTPGIDRRRIFTASLSFGYNF